MKFGEIYYCEYQDLIANWAYAYPNKKGNKGIGGGIILYEINAKGNYKITNNELIIDDDFFEKLKRKL
jgi:hypothetical protein